MTTHTHLVSYFLLLLNNCIVVTSVAYAFVVHTTLLIETSACVVLYLILINIIFLCKLRYSFSHQFLTSCLTDIATYIQGRTLKNVKCNSSYNLING